MVEELAHVFAVGFAVSPADHVDSTTHRIPQQPIHLGVGHEVHLDSSLLEHGVPRELWRLT